MPTCPSPPLTALRLWDDRASARDGAGNMAVDEALLPLAESLSGPVLRFYRWDRPTLSFGYFLSEQEARAALRPGESLIRRWTGGGLVHHENAFTWTLVVPHGDPFCRIRPAESYGILHQALARALTGGGIHPVAVISAEAPAPSAGLCSEAPAPGDVLWQGRKIAGAGQRRTRLGLLHQGVVFLKETDLPAGFPALLASALAGKITTFVPPRDWSPSTGRYTDPAWNHRR